MKTQDYLNEIRQNAGLKHAILQKITVSERRQSAEFSLITDLPYSDLDERSALEITKKYLPAYAHASVKITKLVADEELLKNRIFALLKRRYPAATSFLTSENISVQKTESGATFLVELPSEAESLVNKEELIDFISKELSRSFCGGFLGNVKGVKVEKRELLKEEPLLPAEEIIPPRTFEICDYHPIDGGDKPSRALYIADLTGEAEDVVLAGEIKDIREKETSSGKPMFKFAVSDKTGTIYGSYFSKQRTIEKIRALKHGDFVVLRGANEVYKGNLSFRIKAVNLGSYPENFVPEQKQGKSVPAAYKAVKPEPFFDYNQSGFFDETSLPDALKEREFVVYDIETTGVNYTGVGGRMDAIIELGAVKMKNGAIVEKFSSFVETDRKLGQDIVKLTGITDEMLVGAPPIEEVIADFYKFSYGCALVGHNSTAFDYKFISHYGRENGYYFEGEMFDTLLMSQGFLHLTNHKLNTVADYYGVTFHHHRAFDDALATAKVFIGLLKDGAKLT